MATAGVLSCATPPWERLRCEVTDRGLPARTRSCRARLLGDGRMTGWEMVAVAAAGFAAGGINAVVGSGTLVTFPVLLAVGLPPRDRDRQQLPRPGARQPHRRHRLPPGAGRAAAAAAPAAARLGARRADRRVPAPAPAGLELRGDRAGADRARRGAGRRPAATAARAARPAAGRGRRDGADRARAGWPRCSPAPTPPAPTAATSPPARACCRSASSACCCASRCSGSTRSRTC